MRRHMSQELRSVATNDAILISRESGGLSSRRGVKATERGVADRRAAQQIAKLLMVYQNEADGAGRLFRFYMESHELKIFMMSSSVVYTASSSVRYSSLFSSTGSLIS